MTEPSNPDLSTYECADFEHGPWQRPVYRKGTGPAVIIMHEMPGLHPQVVRFADRVVDAGFTAFVPSLFGKPGKTLSVGYAAAEMFKGICIRREFSTWATDRSSPIVDWLRGLARHAHAQCGGAGVGALGMCFTGGFALAMMTEPSVIAPVLSQPSLPLVVGFGKEKRKRAIDASAAELSCARNRCVEEGISVLGLRFAGDPLVPPERFEFLQEQIGEGFEPIVLQDSDAKAGEPMQAHSVLTVHLDDSSAQTPTRRVEARVIDFFGQRLKELAPEGA